MSTFRALTSPRMLALHVLGAVAVGAAVWLGLWQLGAWQAQREAEAVDLAAADPVPLTDVVTPDGGFPGDSVGRPVTLTGEWLGDETVYVEAPAAEGEESVGYWVVTPVAVCTPDGSPACADAAALPVVRGLADRPEEPAPVEGPVEMTGWLQPPQPTEDDLEPGDDVLPSLRAADLIQRLDRDLYGAFVIAETVDGSPVTATPAGTDLVAVTPASLPEPPAFTALRNFLYGIEWWVFGAFAAFLWWRWARDEVQRRAAETVTEPTADGGPDPDGAQVPSRA